MTEHHLRRAPIHAFKRVDDHGDGAQFLARIHPFKLHPILFSGDTEAEAVGEAMAFCAEAVAKHEAAFIARVERTAKAKIARAKKKVAA